MTCRVLVFRYVLFAILATIANLATQRFILGIDQSERLFFFALVSGTLVGLVLKYLLDRRWLFHSVDPDGRARATQFLLYSVTGFLTTVVFIGIETIFWLAWKTDHMREIGAIIGLSIGYVAKYKLDRRFVFTEVRSWQTL